MDIMDINFDDVIQLLEADLQDFQNENKKIIYHYCYITFN